MFKAVSFSIVSSIMLSSLILTGCDSSTCSSKPLENIEKYQVALFVSPYGELNAEKTKKLLKEKLISLGQVVEAPVPISEEIPLLFISLEPKESANPSTIQVLGKVKVLKNSCELTSVIWSYPFRTEMAFIPVEQDGKITFVQKDNPPFSQNDPLDSLLNAFAEEYKAAHPKQTPITFLISQ